MEVKGQLKLTSCQTVTQLIVNVDSTARLSVPCGVLFLCVGKFCQLLCYLFAAADRGNN